MTQLIYDGILNNIIAFEVFDNSKGDSFKKYTKTLKALSERNLIISNTNLEKRVDFTEFFYDAIKSRERHLNVNRNSLTSDLKGDFIDIKSEDLFNGYYEETIMPGDTVRKDLLEYSQTVHLQRFVENMIREEKHSDQPLLDTKNTFILYPIRIIINSMIIFVDVRITIYKHGYAILNYSTRLREINIDEFNKHLWEIEIDSAFLPRFMLNIENSKQYLGEEVHEKAKYHKLGNCKTLENALKRYERIIRKVIGSDLKGTESYNTLMIPNQNDVGDLDNNQYKENIFILLHSPVRTGLSDVRLKEFFENNIFVKKGFSNTYGNQHRLIYIVPAESRQKLQSGFTTYSKDTINEHFYEAFHGDYFFAIEKLMLRKISNWKYMHHFFGETISSRKLYKINLNRIQESRFENNQVFYKYSSTLELIDALYKTGMDENVTMLLEDNKSKVLEASELRKSIMLSEINVLTSILVIFLTAIFSVPALTQTLEFFGINNIVLIIILYSATLLLVISIVIAAFRYEFLNLFFTPINASKYLYRHFKAVKNTKKYFRNKKL